MATAKIYGSSADAILRRTAADTWANCQAATPSVARTTDTSISAQRTYTTAYIWDRAFLLFDFSPYAGATITAATLNYYISDRNGKSAATFYYLDWGPALAAGDWAALGTAATASQAFSTAYQQKAVSMINVEYLLTANGGLVLALDDESTQPAEVNSASIATFEHATESRRPNIDITYTPAAGLSIPLIHHYRAQQ